MVRLYWRFDARDLWFGLYWDRTGAGLRIYICLIPCLPIMLEIPSLAKRSCMLQPPEYVKILQSALGSGRPIREEERNILTKRLEAAETLVREIRSITHPRPVYHLCLAVANGETLQGLERVRFEKADPLDYGPMVGSEGRWLWWDAKRKGYFLERPPARMEEDDTTASDPRPPRFPGEGEWEE